MESSIGLSIASCGHHQETQGDEDVLQQAAKVSRMNRRLILIS